MERDVSPIQRKRETMKPFHTRLHDSKVNFLTNLHYITYVVILFINSILAIIYLNKQVLKPD